MLHMSFIFYIQNQCDFVYKIVEIKFYTDEPGKWLHRNGKRNIRSFSRFTFNYQVTFMSFNEVDTEV